MAEQTRFDGWAIVDVLGHQRFLGKVTTEYFGDTAFFRVDTPMREQRDDVLVENTYITNYGTCEPDTRVTKGKKDGSLRFIGAGSIYMITPRTEADLMKELEETDRCPVLSVVGSDGVPKVMDDEMPW